MLIFSHQEFLSRYAHLWTTFLEELRLF